MHLTYLAQIEWDAPARQAKKLPESFAFFHDGYDSDEEALDAAMNEASEIYGFAIEDCEAKHFVETL